MRCGKLAPTDPKARVKLPDALVREWRPKQIEDSRVEEETEVKPDPPSPVVRLAAVTVRQPSTTTRKGSDDPFGLRQHLADQRCPRAPQPAGPKPRMTPPKK